MYRTRSENDGDITDLRRHEEDALLLVRISSRLDGHLACHHHRLEAGEVKCKGVMPMPFCAKV